MVDRLVSTGHRLAVLTDHNRIQGYDAARASAERKGLVLLPGAEIYGKVPAIQEGTGRTTESFFHLLLILDPDVPKLVSRFENLITNNKPQLLSEGNRKDYVVDLLSSQTFRDFAERVHESQGLIIPAHLHSDPRHPEKSRSIDDIFADALFLDWAVTCRFDALEVLDAKTAAFFDGAHSETSRLRISCLRSSDAHIPEEIGRRSTWLKMETVSYGGLRLALQDRETRVALVDPRGSQHHRILGARITGRFFEDQWVRFNDDLNCIIGAKGKGKSALLESLRFALNLAVPEISSSTKERQKFSNRNQALLDNILGARGSVECIVESAAGTRYLFRRSRGDAAPTITSETDGVEKPYYDLTETFGCRFYGWEELTSCSEELNLLTDVFDAHFTGSAAGRDDSSLPAVQRALADNERQLDAALADIQARQNELDKHLATEAQINSLVAKLESESRGQKDLALCIEHQEASSAEESVLGILETYLALTPCVVLHGSENPDESISVDEPAERLSNEADPPHLSDGKAERLFAKPVIAKRQYVWRCLADLCALHASTKASAASAWQAKSAPVLAALERSVKEYRAALDHDAERVRAKAGVASESEASRRLAAIGKLQKGITGRRKDLRGKNAAALEARLAAGHRKYLELSRDRRRLYSSITIGRSRIAAELTERYSSILKATFEPRCQFDDYRGQLKSFFSNSGLQFNTIVECILAKRIMPETLCVFLLNWKDRAVMRAFNLSEEQAAKLRKHTYSDLLSRVKPFHAVEVPDVPQVKMLVDPTACEEDEEARYRLVSRLSAGERSTVVLPLVTHGTPDPLVIDQPEDDLDNAYIHDSFVHSLLRKSKCVRQFIFATHNANIPVLGDAENVLVMEASREKGRVLAQGCTDVVATQIMDILEGGRQAFRDRSAKYGIGPSVPPHS